MRKLKSRQYRATSSSDLVTNAKPKPKTKHSVNVSIKVIDSLRASVKELIMVRANKAAYAINAIKHDARIRAEQDADRVLKNLKLKLLGQKYDEVAITSDTRHKHYKANESRIESHSGILVRKYYNETGHIKQYKYFYQNN